MSIVSPRCLLDAVRQSGLLVEVVSSIFAISESGESASSTPKCSGAAC
jgi:hypothetical protein